MAPYRAQQVDISPGGSAWCSGRFWNVDCCGRCTLRKTLLQPTGCLQFKVPCEKGKREGAGSPIVSARHMIRLD